MFLSRYGKHLRKRQIRKKSLGEFLETIKLLKIVMFMGL